MAQLYHIRPVFVIRSNITLLFTACGSQRPEVPTITETQASRIEQEILNASADVCQDGVWIYVSTGDSGKEAPATIVSVQLDTDTNTEGITVDFVSITKSLEDIEFEIPLGHLVVTYSSSDGQPVFVFMSYDLVSCSLTDYRGGEPELNEYASIDELSGVIV